jgi:endonuclease/exonuclease/phosphatase family metal-dependent hydrolase
VRYIFLLFLPLFLFSKPIKIATYNVENLFDESFQGTEYEEYIPGKHNWNKRMVGIKLNHTAEVICDIDADIIGLQEVENKHIFKQLIAKLDKVGCSYKYSAITAKKGASIQVAVLSRYAITRKKDLQVSYSPRVRNILEVEVEVQGKALTLFVNHWKSKAYKGYESKRIKYAKVLQARIARLSPSKEYIILGDFNSDYNSYLTLDEKNNDTQGLTGFSDVLHTRTEENEMPKAKQGIHYTLWKELEVEDRWSYKFYGKKSSLDQIVLPRSMFDGRGFDYVNDSFKVFKADYLFTKRGYINKWRYKNGKHKAKGYSDHLPVFAYFDNKPYEKSKKQNFFHKIKTKFIEYFYTIEELEEQIKLEDAVVVLKRGRNAVVKQSPKGRGVFLYGCASKLEEGRKYDLLVDGIKTYNGLKEVISAYKLKDKGRVDTKPYLSGNHKLDKLSQNEVIIDVKGIYNNRHLVMGDRKIPIYFKKKKSTPKNGTALKIHYAHLGYYKKEQLVVYSSKDFTILE